MWLWHSWKSCRFQYQWSAVRIHSLANCILPTYCQLHQKDENKEKEAGEWPIEKYHEWTGFEVWINVNGEPSLYHLCQWPISGAKAEWNFHPANKFHFQPCPLKTETVFEDFRVRSCMLS